MNWRSLLTKLNPKSFIMQHKLITLVLTIILLTWLFGGFLGLTTLGKFFISVIIIVMYFGFLAWRYWQDKQHENKMETELQQQTAGVDLLPLRKNVAAAITALRRSQTGTKLRGSKILYELPWYLMLGASGSGKTSLLRNSGLNFPLNSDEEIELKGFTGTKDVDWWFADEAVILDTAGRYTTNVEARKEWLGLLQILKRQRWRMPLNGVLISLNIEEILLAEKNDLDKQAACLRERINELNQYLGYILPINIVFTKLDLLTGFTELFSGCAAEQLEDLWGISLQSLTIDNNINESITEQFAILRQRLTNFALQQLDVITHTDKKAKAHRFITQFKTVLQRIEDFIFLVTSDNPYQTKFNLRGIYFTSAYQHGFKIESKTIEKETRFVQVDSADDMPPSSKQSVSFFIHNLLSQAVFKDRNAAVMNQRTKMIVNSAQYSALGLAGLVLLLILVFWGVSYAFNNSQLKQSVTGLGHLQAVLNDKQADQWDQLSAQLEVYESYAAFANHTQQLPFHKRMGLYRGTEQQVSLQKTLSTSLQNNFLYPVAHAYEEKLAYYAKEWPRMSEKHKKDLYFKYYQTLRNYLELGVYNPEPKKADVESITNTWVKLLSKQKSNSYGSMLNTSQLANLVSFYLQNSYSGISPDSLVIEWLPKRSIVATAREQLRRPVDISLLITRLKQSLQDKMAPVSLDKLLPSDAASMFVDKYQLPSMYTATAWEKVVRSTVTTIANEASAGDWVLNQPISINQNNQYKPVIDDTKPDPMIANKLRAKMLSAYFNEYLQAWFKWMQHLRLKNLNSLSDVSDALIKLGKTDGPMVALLETIAKNLQIKDADTHWQLFSKNNEAPVIYKKLLGTDGFINADLTDKNSDAVKQYLQAVKAIQTDVENISVGSNQAQGADKYAKAILSGNSGSNNLFKARITVGQLLENVTDGQSQAALQAVLVAPLRAAWRGLLVTAAKQIQTQWQNQVIPVFQNQLDGKVPFVTEGTDADIATMQSFFAPKTGVYWKFVKKYLTPYVTQQGVHWTTAKWLGTGMPLSAAFEQNLNQAQNISSTLFASPATSGKFYYSIYPIPEAGVSQVKLVVNNQTYAYSNGPQRWHYFHWDQKQKPQQSVLTVNKNDGEASARSYAGGLWSLFKLLSTADELHKVGSYYVVHWDLEASDGHTVRAAMRFRTDGSSDAIAGLVLHPFKPPYSLITKGGN